MSAPFAFDSDPFAAPFKDALVSSSSSERGTAIAAYPAAEIRPESFRPVRAGMAPVAEALRAAGFGQAALSVARLVGDERAEEWSAVATADAALASLIATHGEVAIPSVQIRDDGVPRFVVCGDDPRALSAHVEAEHGEGGVDSELRLFLDEALRPGDRYLDARPAAGFAVLSAATRTGVEVIALVEDETAGDALRRSARASGCDAAVTVRYVDDAQALVAGDHAGATVLHAGHAGNVAVLLQAMRAQCGAVPADVVAWRCGSARDADYDAEAMQVAAAVLGVLGFRHFALASGERGLELVPAETMASNTMIFSLGERFLARAGA